MNRRAGGGKGVGSTVAVELFKEERQLFKSGQALLKAPPSTSEAWEESYGGLLEGYRKLVRRTQRLVRLSDRNEAELNRITKSLQAANQAKANFLATTSHEIRTPMNGVVGMIDLLRESSLDDDQHQMVETIRESAFSMLAIINDILDFSKIEAGRLELERVPISLRDIIEGVAETLAPNVNSKGIRISTFIDPDIPDGLLGDQVRIRQILFNLAGNAAKFTEAGKVLVRADRGSVDQERVTVRFQVIDSGIGIAEEIHETLFEDFTQAETSTARRFGGTGLGLSICRQLSEMMGSTITVDSVPGKGSTFTIDLPFDVAPERAIRSDRQDLTDIRVLVVTRDDDMRPLFARYLEHCGAVPTALGDIAATSTAIALAADLDQPFDVVLIGSGWPIEQRLGAVGASQATGDGKDVRFVVMTTKRTQSYRPQVAGVHWVGSDPLRRAGLLRAVAIAVGRASPDVLPDDRKPMEGPAVPAPTVDEAEALV